MIIENTHFFLIQKSSKEYNNIEARKNVCIYVDINMYIYMNERTYIICI